MKIEEADKTDYVWENTVLGFVNNSFAKPPTLSLADRVQTISRGQAATLMHTTDAYLSDFTLDPDEFDRNKHGHQNFTRRLGDGKAEWYDKIYHTDNMSSANFAPLTQTFEHLTRDACLQALLTVNDTAGINAEEQLEGTYNLSASGTTDSQKTYELQETCVTNRIPVLRTVFNDPVVSENVAIMVHEVRDADVPLGYDNLTFTIWDRDLSDLSKDPLNATPVYQLTTNDTDLIPRYHSLNKTHFLDSTSVCVQDIERIGMDYSRVTLDTSEPARTPGPAAPGLALEPLAW